MKFRLVTLNFDAYHIRYQNAYSASPDPSSPTATQYTASGDSLSQGFEGEANLSLTHGFTVYINGTAGNAKYVSRSLPSYGRWVANTPSNTQAVGLIYQHRGFDLGVFNKRVGPMWNDNTGLNGATVNQVIPIDPFNVTNAFFNYTIRKASHLAQTKLRLSVNNLFDQHNITSVTQVTKGAVYAPGPDDTLGMLPGRSVTLTVTLGYAPRVR